jgi:choline dehydrogenase-like flavoprotein
MSSRVPNKTADFAIIGGGSAGSALAPTAGCDLDAPRM